MSKKRIVLTGASRGLGRAMTDLLIQQGHIVHGCATNKDAVKSLQANYAGEHTFHVVNVSDYSQVEEWAESVLTHGAPDLLLNNAALINENNRLWEVPPEEFSRVVDVNVKGVYHVVKCFAPAMVERQSGVIVNFSSTWGRSVSPEVAPYCATKFAIEGLTLGLAAELPHGMAAVPLNPGVINTDMLKSCFGGGASSFPTAGQWAETAVPFLLSLGAKDNGKSLTAP